MRIIAFDYIRVLSIIAIVICHICFGIGLDIEWLGRYLGCTFNMTFFALSSLLLGLAWSAKGKSYDSNFLAKRITRVITSYWPFLILAYIALVAVNNAPTVKQAVLNFVMLGWFAKIPCLGHLWFLTMLFFCYVTFMLISKLQRRNLPTCFVIFVGVCLILMHVKIPTCFGIVLVSSCAVYCNADKILNWLKEQSFIKWMPVYLLITLCGLYLFKSDIFAKNQFIAYMVGAICGLAQLAYAYLCFKQIKANVIVSYLSSISFDIYMVHHAFCFGEYSIFKAVDNKIVAILCIGLISIGLGIMLHAISNSINKCLTNK